MPVPSQDNANDADYPFSQPDSPCHGLPPYFQNPPVRYDGLVEVQLKAVDVCLLPREQGHEKHPQDDADKDKPFHPSRNTKPVMRLIAVPMPKSTIPCQSFKPCRAR